MRYLLFVLFLVSVTSCASAAKNIQPQINSLVTANRLEKASAMLGMDPSVYGAHNHLRFWLDKGMVEHLRMNFAASIAAFEEAENLNAALFTQSLSQMANTWIVNDAKKDYQGDEQENVMINVFQAFNYAALGDFEEALVEARRLEQKLRLIGPRYQNPFAYLLSGMLWHFSGEKNAGDDAIIEYEKAKNKYDVEPKLLTQLMTMAEEDGQHQAAPAKARLIIVAYTGFIPIKVADAIVLPLDGNHMTKMSFPRYQDRYSELNTARVKIKQGGLADVRELEVVCDLGELAKKILAGKKVSTYAKAGIRPLLKYGVQKAIEIPVRDKAGDVAGDLLGIAGSIYSLATEEADLRTWQSLPNQIRMAVYELDPGTYDVDVEHLNEGQVIVEQRSLQQVVLRSGDVKFITYRSWL